ncbi:lysophosphatidic acid receptor 4-like isoform X2 [Numida meleagris]|uniref:lysophosphatidic acid receptor 4-like isoform X2 n=1 Tax=Numida meleagris TaxID=8996 RepID=UPI000B3DB1EF|nr:lysophosphatidic acid receptor 4-like isoform X2 [Numida meleagris]
MGKASSGCFVQQTCSSLAGISRERDHMKDFRRYLVLKYIQYLVLSSSNAIITLLGVLGSGYVMLILHSARVSSKSTSVFISSLAKADLLIFISVVAELFLWTSGVAVPRTAFTPVLLQNLLTANAHISALLLSCVAVEAYLITFFPVESRRLRTVRNARLTCRAIWLLVATECVLLQADDVLKASGASPSCTSGIWLLHLSSGAAAILRAFSYLLGILLRIVNVYIYYKIFFSVSNRATVRTK